MLRGGSPSLHAARPPEVPEDSVFCDRTRLVLPPHGLGPSEEHVRKLTAASDRERDPASSLADLSHVIHVACSLYCQAAVCSQHAVCRSERMMW